MAAGVTKAIRNEALYAKRTYVAERHRRANLAVQVSSIARPRHPLGAEIRHFLLCFVAFLAFLRDVTADFACFALPVFFGFCWTYTLNKHRGQHLFFRDN